MTEPTPTHETGFAALLALVGQQRRRLIVAALCSALSGVLSITPLIALYLVLVTYAQGSAAPFAEVLPILIGCGAAMLLRWLLLCSGGVLSHLAAFDSLHDLRLALANKLTRLPLGWIDARTASLANQVLREDIDRLEQFIAHHLNDSAAALALPLASAVALFWLDWRMALATLATVPLALAVQIALFKRIPQVMAEYGEVNAELSASIVDYVQGIAVVKTYLRGEHATGRLHNALDAYRAVIGRMVASTVPGWSAFTVVIGANSLFILPIGGYFYLNGSLTLQAFTLCLLLGLGITRPLFALAFFGNLMRLVQAANDRVQTLLRAPELASQAQLPAGDSEHALAFEQVGFSYDQGGQVLHDISFNLPHGSLTAIVGPSGAGKSTLAQLMLRFWDVQQGRITLQGRDLRAWPLGELHDQVAFVMQEVHLFDQSVLDNIRLGRSDIDEAQVIAAAKAAQAHDFIQALPQGYHTVLGERGARLSGGERQRLSIARALVRNAPIVVLDEATAFADPMNEAQILQALGTLTAGRTVVMIAHRLASIVDADQVLLLEAGRIRARGSHAQLLAAEPLYQQLWHAQQASANWRLGHSPALEPTLEAARP
ncbi:ABC transporter ATP-binding protein [Pantoea sp. Tr-811]|uniref:ABC transporter ATP-binding protein n=1 Tax=unclassified Pantoea TaxID=2630326 RepID=UPI001420D938|nr:MULTISPECIES: ABC transporter ATP-binding protein [unclassified Pantoea]NIE78420.1 ABC transporter ATP-binding protein [Pantoea sp. Ap-967]NIF29088.1 ABC transporter ATP-binding protein [Pantoea sp. Tr-811]